MANKNERTPRWGLELQREERMRKNMALVGGALFLLALLLLVIGGIVVGGAR